MLNEMDKRALLVFLVEKMKNSGSWCGETHIQKCVYFLQHLLMVPMKYNFILYKHGPYSFDLTDEITFLKGNAFLELHPRLPYGPSLSPGRFSTVLKKKHSKAISHYTREIGFVVKALADKTVRELERIATALYVKKEKNWTTEKDIIEKIVQLKPHITVNEASGVLGYLNLIEEQADVLLKDASFTG